MYNKTLINTYIKSLSKDKLEHLLLEIIEHFRLSYSYDFEFVLNNLISITEQPLDKNNLIAKINIYNKSVIDEHKYDILHRKHNENNPITITGIEGVDYVYNYVFFRFKYEQDSYEHTDRVLLSDLAKYVNLD
jgi:hypothetical protein